MSTHRPWYKRYPGDFIAATMSLTLEEKGAFSLCLDLFYDRGGPIPDEPRWLAGVCGVSVRKWTALRGRLIETGKLVVVDGHLTNRRAEREIAAAESGARKREENGAKGGRKRAENAVKTDGNSLETDRDVNEINGPSQVTLKHLQKPEARIEENRKISSKQQPGGESERAANSGADPDRRPPALPAGRTTIGADPTRRGTGRDDRAAIEAALRRAAGLDDCRSPWSYRIGPILGLIDAGFDLERDILPPIRAKAAAGHLGSIHSWGFFATICREERAARDAGRSARGVDAVTASDLDRARAEVRRVREEASSHVG